MVRLTSDGGLVRPVTRETLSGLDWLNGDIADLRQRYETACRILPERATWRTIPVADRLLGLLIHDPAGSQRSDRVIVYFHGGGWIVGSPFTHADISGALSDVTKVSVVSVDYRLAPEHVVPAPIDDGLAAIDYALSLQPNQAGSIILAGDSAGAAIALAVAAQARPGLRERILCVCACYGSYGLLDGESLRALGSRTQGLDRECVERMWLAANPPGGMCPYSIDYIVRGIGSPVYVLAGGQDPLLDDSLALAEGLRRGGRSVVLDMIEAAPHGFLHGGRESPRARAALQRIAAWIEGI